MYIHAYTVTYIKNNGEIITIVKYRLRINSCDLTPQKAKIMPNWIIKIPF